MAAKPRALLLSPEAPYPLHGGGALRTAGLLHYLARHFAVDAILFQEPDAPDPRAAIPAGLVQDSLVIPLPRHSRSLAARVARNAIRYLKGAPPLVDRFGGFVCSIRDWAGGRRWELGVIEHFWCAPYVEALGPLCRSTVLDLHNIESDLHARLAAEPGLAAVLHRRFGAACERLERRWVGEFVCSIVTSIEDKEKLKRKSKPKAVIVYPNTIPDPGPLPGGAREPVIVFSGNMQYHPNVSGVRFFAREVWPGLAARHPGHRWKLVGRNPGAVAGLIGGAPRVSCTGPVENALAELARAEVAVAPLLSGSGTRVKILEAWAAGTPVVSTTIGAEGLPARHGENILVADGAAAFSGAVTSLIEDAELRRRIAAGGVATFRDQFTWEAGWRELDASLLRLILREI